MPAADLPVFRRVGIVGTGLLGASIGLAVKRQGAEVIGLDRRPEHLETCEEKGAIDRRAASLAELRDCDLIVLATPPSLVVSLAQETKEATTEALVIDVASVKADIAQGAADARFVPTHPMAGGEIAGPARARADLFEGATWVICPEKADAKAADQVEAWIQSLSAKPLRTGAAEHDRHVALVSHLPHVLAAGLLRQFADYPHRQLTGPSWRDLTRVGSADPGLWGEILTQNREEVLQAMHAFQNQLEEFRKAVENRDEAEIRRLFLEAGEQRNR